MIIYTKGSTEVVVQKSETEWRFSTSERGTTATSTVAMPPIDGQREVCRLIREGYAKRQKNAV